jgi:hypothetical protein
MTRTEVFIGLGLAAVLALCFIGAALSGAEWEKFKVAHECKIVGQTSADVGLGFNSAPNGGGTTVIVTPGKTGWACNDGVTYWR